MRFIYSRVDMPARWYIRANVTIEASRLVCQVFLCADLSSFEL